MRWRFLLTISISLCALAGAFLLGVVLYISHEGTLDFSVLERSVAAKPTIVLDDTGKEWTRFQYDRREPVVLSAMPKHLVHAFVAAEDWDFFSHKGISYKGIVRSTLVNLYHRRIVQGASTITQQLVKLLFFDAQRTFSRKIKEQLYALLLEQQYSKEYIMQMYLNNVYFGCGIYGVEAASQAFWGKSAAQMTVDEAAVLAGIVRSPGLYCPLLHPEASLKVRNTVLSKMARLHFIREDECSAFKKQPLVLAPRPVDDCAPHLKEMIRLFLEERFGRRMLYTGGLVVQTTLSRSLQRQAEKAFAEQIANLRVGVHEHLDGAVFSMDSTTGGVKALIGGRSFKLSQFNRAMQTVRQIGSVIKPLVYAAALEKGRTFADTMIDEPLSFEQPNGQTWMPNNYNLQFEGEMTLARALYRSNNTIAIKTLLEAGYDRVIELARRCGLHGAFNRYPSLALGCVDGTLQEVTAMFNIFAHNGCYVEPHFIVWVKNSLDVKIYRHEAKEHRVLASLVSDQVAKALMLSLKQIKYLYPDQWLATEAMSKTGTTNDCRTCWYVGSTPGVTTGVYIGCDDNSPLGKNIYPLRTAFPIWLAMHRSLPVKQMAFTLDPRLKTVLVDERTGRRARHEGDGVIEIAVA